ncbi:MAG: GNAT family N-acetyltransferase [Clostridia bacterium]|nr:GNAT family N-acetyltransferase [Clostridia bacterium]
MRYLREITLANGESILLRSLETKDAGAAIFCFRKVAGETQFLLRETDECGITIAQEEETIARKLESPREMLLGAFVGEALVGMAGLNAVGQLSRVRHRAGVGVSLEKAYWGKGIGKAMMTALIDAARQAGYEQLELDVVDKNERAIALYERLGFRAVGRMPKAMKYRGGGYADLVYMVLEL